MRIAKAKFHFIGIGGIGMSGLAEILRNLGARVQGSDAKESQQTRHLKNLGIEVFVGHRAGQVKDSDVVVYSSAIPEDNPEIQEARANKIPIIPRAEVLAELMRLKRGVAVGGSHGKTTTTAMTASVFLEAKKDPTVVVGGRVDLIKSNALLGQGEWMIAEADESDGSFLKLSPEITVITNIDNDHLDFHKNMEGLESAFFQFALRTPFYGHTIVCGDDTRIRQLFRDYHKRILYYGFGPNNDFVLKALGSEKYQVAQRGQVLGEFQLSVPGRHNALNALAAVVCGLEADIPFEVIAKGLRSFSGVDRRFQSKGEVAGIRVYDDYGHHPTEVRAVIQAARERFPKDRLVVAFQPHRYSRTQICWNEFLSCFEGADLVWMWDIYPASERPIPGITAQRLAGEIENTKCIYVASGPKALDEVVAGLRPGDVLVTLGAGDISEIGPRVLEGLRSKS